MKTLAKPLAFLLALVSLSLPAAFAADGQEGHGGDPFALEFVGVGRILSRFFNQIPEQLLTQFPGFSAQKISEAVEKTRVVSRLHVYLDGEEVDAKNYWKRKLIRLGRLRWAGTANDPRKRVLLVLHEYLGIAQRDRRYELSNLFQVLVEHNPDLVVRVGGLKSCGLAGPLEERAAECERVFGARGDGWKLLMKLEESFSVVRDAETGLVWTDFENSLGFGTLIDARKDCALFGGTPSLVFGLKSNLEALMKFRLPTADEFAVADQ
ncbi:MAG: hypothetical protein HY075_07365, partial [Deltaproteobacteria bacterium]|nr:hypothetical protein [Deltaproteobacteria bacterium]